LVGVLAADMSLYGGDYRSYERTFGLLMQVIGRCGRAGLSGRAYIQTYSPEHSVLIRASAQDYRAFYEDEILNRRVMLYPPYCAMGSVLFSGEKEMEVREAAETFSAMFGERLKAADLPARLLGPTPSRVPKVAGKWRWKLIMKYRPDGAFFRVTAEALKAFVKESRYGKTEVSVDPSDIG
ncbi:MAG TPA: primosomal protein N', partial [Oscillospiraceae bacterium]|nr:primosomal protein N' [Oscillospiraceae bacterium]